MDALWLCVIASALTIATVLSARPGSQLKCYKLKARIEAVRESYLRPVTRRRKCDPKSAPCPPQFKIGYRKKRVSILERTGEPILIQALNDRYQQISTPRFPKPYFRNIECEWDFLVPAKHQAAVVFKAFNLEESLGCVNDYVIVAGSKTDTKLCGYRNSTVKIKGLKRKRILIRFRSDSGRMGARPNRVGFKGFFVALARKRRRQGNGRTYLWNDSSKPHLFFEPVENPPSGVELLDNGDPKKTIDALVNAIDSPEVREFTQQSVSVDWSQLEEKMQEEEERAEHSGESPK